MKRLVGFELKKIFTRRLTMLALLMVVLLSLLLTFSTYHNKIAYDGREQAKGGAAIALDKSIAARYAGILTDEKVQQMLADLVPPSDTINAAYIYLNATQSATAAHFADVKGQWNGKSVAEVFGREMMVIGYVDGWLGVSRDMQKILVMLSFVLIMMLAPVFAGEYGGVEAILLSTYYGRSQCIKAKVLAAFSAAVGVTAFIVGGCLLLAFLLYGSEGLACSILFAPQGSSYDNLAFDMTCRELLFKQILLALTSALSLTGLTLVFSAACRNMMTALAVAAMVHSAPVFLPVAESHPLFRVLALSPLGQVQFASLVSISPSFFWWAIPVALGASVIGYGLARRLFANHEVS